jgi:hypothetical protein
MTQEFKDRSGALIAVGVVEILGGALFTLFTILIPFSLQMAPQETPAVQMAFPILMYGALSVWFFIMGIGTIRAKRWARSLMLAASWFSLVIGIAAIAFFVTMLPSMRSQMNDMTATIIVTTMGLVFGVFYIIVPIIGILVYNGKNVRATCEHRNPEPAWTDRCPLPVLALSLLLLFGACSLITQIAANFVFPFFGTLQSGPIGLALWAVSALLFCSLAIGLYKLKVAAWWATLAFYSLLSLSSLLTFSQISMDDFYTAANYSESMRQQMQNLAWMNEGYMIKCSLFFSIPTMVYLLFIKRYFKQSKSKEILND